MPEIACPKCSKRVEAPQDAVGRTVKCPSCGHAYLVTAPAEPPLPKLLIEPARILAEPRSRRLWPLVAVLVVGLLIGSGMTWALFGPRDPQHSPTVEASAPNNGAAAQTAGPSNDELTRKYQEALETIRTEKTKYEKLVQEKSQLDAKLNTKNSVTESIAVRLQRYNLLSDLLNKEESKMEQYRRECARENQRIACQVFRNWIPKDTNDDGIAIEDPRNGRKSISFYRTMPDNPEGRRQIEQRLENMRTLADKFVQEMRSGHADLGDRISSEMDTQECYKDYRRQEELITRLKRERDEAQAALGK